jgi:hypothetical protein
MDDRRSPIELAIESLLIAIGAQHVPAGEANQFVGRTRTVNGTHQLGRVVEPPPISGLAKPDTDWCERHENHVEEGAHCRDQHDEQDTLEDDFRHMLLFREYETALGEFQTAEVPADGLNPAMTMARKLAFALGASRAALSVPLRLPLSDDTDYTSRPEIQ